MKIFKLALIILFLFSFYLNLFSSNFDHSVYDEILKKHVENGLVDYKTLKTNDAALDKYLKQLKQINPDEFDNWSKNEKLALWINAYNAITIEGILRSYPIEYGGILDRIRFPKNSIRQIDDFWNKVFVKVMGKNLTLNEIEHDILRKKFDDPRIHFVIVCASMDCPKLESRAFVAGNLNQRLEQATHDFINNPKQVRLDKDENILYLSSIFEWYKEDFSFPKKELEKWEDYKSEERGIMQFVIQYLPEAEKEYIMQNKPEIRYLDYDWSLNELKRN